MHSFIYFTAASLSLNESSTTNWLVTDAASNRFLSTFMAIRLETLEARPNLVELSALGNASAYLQSHLEYPHHSIRQAGEGIPD